MARKGEMTDQCLSVGYLPHGGTVVRFSGREFRGYHDRYAESLRTDRSLHSRETDGRHSYKGNRWPKLS